MKKLSTTEEAILHSPQYTPNRLLNFLHEKYSTKSAHGLALKLNVSPSTIWKIEHKILVIGSGLMVHILDNHPELSIQELRRLAGIPKDKWPVYLKVKKEV